MHTSTVRGGQGAHSKRHSVNIDDENYLLEAAPASAEMHLLNLIQGRFGRQSIDLRKEAATFKLHKSPGHQETWDTVLNFLKGCCPQGAPYGKLRTSCRKYQDYFVSFSVHDDFVFFHLLSRSPRRNVL